MYELVYSSRAIGSFLPSEMLEMLNRARERNRACGVSGLLVFDGSGFVQLLEGPQTAVESTYEFIADDPRHVNLQVLWRGKSPEDLQFPEWEMALLDTREGEWRHHADLAPFAAEGTRAITAAYADSRSTGRKMLLSLRLAL